MEIDYSEIGRRIAKRRKELGLRQAQVCELAEINDKYLSCIERATSIPSLDVLMRICFALKITPNELLIGATKRENEPWKDTSELLQRLDEKQLSFAHNFLKWLSEQEI